MTRERGEDVAENAIGHKPLLVLAGPTAVGKTSLSLRLAREAGAEIISADSMQVYRGMDIGSAKILPGERGGIPHYLIDELDPTEDFHVVKFVSMAKEAMETIYSHGKIPLLVGGTGFYIQAVTRDIDFTQADAKGTLREELERKAEELGPHALHEELRAVDAESAALIHENNVKRVIRALEFYYQNQYPISAHNEVQKEKPSPYRLAYFVLNLPREELYRRIDARVDAMMQAGLLKEVEGLRDMGCRRGMSSMQGLGYKELLDYLEGDIPLEEAVRRIKRDTRHFAKRQITWFKREKDVIWMDKTGYGGDEERIVKEMLRVLCEKGILRYTSYT